MGPQFFETRMGQKFYTADVPRIAKALERIADSMEKHSAPEITPSPDASCSSDFAELIAEAETEMKRLKEEGWTKEDFAQALRKLLDAKTSSVQAPDAKKGGQG
ncbi:MAG: hypothetical protein C0402_05545 [Thermodesulfovibrio sp.]|nr:hypothetical protein [Thermodesulfovibrio sp.]